MTKTPKKYPIEREAEKFIREMRLSLIKIIKFFFIIPKKKMDKYIYVIESLSWLLLTFALLWRILR